MNCTELTRLREWLVANGFNIYSEDGEEPYGWVNVQCPCGSIHEVSIRIDRTEDWDS